MNDKALFSVRLQRPEDDEAIVDLLKASFGSWPKIDAGLPPIEHLRWKKSLDPEAAEYNCVAVTDRRIVGAQFYWLQDTKVGGTVVRAAQGIDFCVHPDYQGRGIRTAMKVLAYETVELTTEFSLSVDGDHPAMVHMVEKTNDERFLMANKLNVLQCDVPRVSLPANNGAVRVRRVSHFDERTGGLCAEASAPFQLIVVRTRDYLNWRYADKRAGAYSICFAEEDGRLVGYATARSANGKGYIADLLALPGRTDAIGALLRHTLADFASEGAATAECWSFVHHPYQTTLSEAGFSTKRRTRPVRARPRGKNPDLVTFRDDPKALCHLTAGDCDLA
jgi:GNAT superfamily N-acetyltransferase